MSEEINNIYKIEIIFNKLEKEIGCYIHLTKKVYIGGKDNGNIFYGKKECLEFNDLEIMEVKSKFIIEYTLEKLKQELDK